MKKETVRPLGENVLVMPQKAETKTKSGIVLPDTATEEKPQEGKVIAVGDDKKIKVKKNQRVLFAKYSGSEVKVGNEEYLIIKSDDILAVIE